MIEVTEGVYFIQGQDEMIPDSHVYLIGMASSKDLTLVDAGLTGKGKYKLQSLTNAGIDLTSIKRIIMTHTHLDHIGCLVRDHEGDPDSRALDPRLLKQSRLSRAMTVLSTAWKCSNRCVRRSTGSRLMRSNSRCIENCRMEKPWTSGV